MYRGADINVQNQEGNTALHLAVMHLHKVRRLVGASDLQASYNLLECLKHNPMPDIENNEGQTAWDEAFGCDEEQICFWLEEAERLQRAYQLGISGIEYTITDTDEEPEIQDLEASGWDGEIITLQPNEISRYKDYFLGRRNWYGGLCMFDDNPAGRLAWDVYTKQVYPNSSDCAEGEERATMAFLRSVAHGNLQTIEHLLAKNAALANRAGNLRQSLQQSIVKLRIPLTIAAEQGGDDICRLLIETGANVNNADGVYLSPLNAAAWGGHLSTLTLLIEAGTQINHIKNAIKRFSESHVLSVEHESNKPVNIKTVLNTLQAAVDLDAADVSDKNLSVQDLIKHLDTYNPEIATSPLITIGEVAIEPLCVALSNSSWRIAASASYILGKIGNPTAVEPLIQSANQEVDEYGENPEEILCVIKAAIWALGQIRDVKGIAPILKLMRKHYVY